MVFDFKQEPGKVRSSSKRRPFGEPLVSIITPYYLASTYINQTALSIFNQTFPYWEWIIIDDGNPEAELAVLNELAAQDGRIRLLSQNNQGPSIARNLGIRTASSDIIIPLDSDDLIEPTYIECLYWTLQCNPDAAWAYTDSVGFQKHEYLWKKSFSAEAMKKENLLTCTAAIRKKDLLEAGLYGSDEKHYYEDWALWLKLLANNKFPVHVDYYGFWYRKTESGGLHSTQQNKDRHKRAMEIVSDLSSRIDTSDIQPIEYPRYKGINFAPPRKWEWNRPLISDKEGKHRLLLLLPHMVMGGADLFNLDLTARLDREQFEVSVITTSSSDSGWRQRFEKQTDEVFDLTTFLDVKEWSSFIHYFIHTRGIDTLMVSNSYYGYYLLPWLRKEFPGLAIVDYVHAEEMGWRAGGFARTSAAASDILEKTYVCNEHLRQLMIHTFGRRPDDVETIYIGVDTEEYDPVGTPAGAIKSTAGLSSGQPVVLFPCRITEQKRPFLMLEIAKKAKVRLPGIIFAVVGDGPQLDSLRDCVYKERLEDTVLLLGRQDDMRPYYRDSDLTLICSIREGLALTAYESLAMGVPVISSDVGGQSELIDDAVGKLLPLLQKRERGMDIETGTEYSDAEIEQYVEAIFELLDDPVRYRMIKETSRDRVVKGFGKSHLIEAVSIALQGLHEPEMKQCRIKKSVDLANFPRLVDDYVSLYCEFQQLDLDINWILNQPFGPQVGSHSSSDSSSLFQSRGWRLFQKYRNFMDNTKIGRRISLLRDLIVNRDG